MTRRLPTVLLTLAALATAAPAAAAHAAPAPASGTLAGGKGWTVLAIGADGRAVAARASASGAFRIPAAKGATLQLVRPGGTYFGPVVLGRARAGRMAAALSGRGGSLGRVTLAKGFAIAAQAPVAMAAKGPGVHVDRHGAPVGAGHLGLVAAAPAKARAAAAAAGSDPDADGIPNAMDADDDGDGIPDAVDSSTGATGAGLFSEVQVILENSLNANATGASPAAIDEFVRKYLALNFYLDGHAAHGAAVDRVDVDCLGLAYCRRGGTGVISMSGNTAAGLEGTPWPSLDTDGDGLPDIPASPQQPGVFSLQFHPSVATAQIAPGDTYQVHLRGGGGDIVVPTALTLYFETSTAAASLNGQAVQYPASGSTLGARFNPVRLDGDSLRVELWRPQRAALPGEAGSLVDMGHLHYGVPLNVGGREIACGAGAFSALSPTLRAEGGADFAAQLFPLQDTAGDAAPSPERRIAFTMDVGGCLRANGVDPVGQLVSLPLTAVDEARPGGMDRASQLVWACLPGCTVPTEGGPQDGTPGAGAGSPGPGAESAQADLAPHGLAAQDVAGGCQLSWTVDNRGTAMSPPSSTGVHATGGSGAADATAQLESLAAGESRGQTVTVPGACAGRTVRVVVDETGTVPELHDDNNELQQAV